MTPRRNCAATVSAVARCPVTIGTSLMDMGIGVLIAFRRTAALA